MLIYFFSLLPILMFLVGCVWTFSLAASTADGKVMIAGLTFSITISFVLVIWLLPH